MPGKTKAARSTRDLLKGVFPRAAESGGSSHRMIFGMPNPLNRKGARTLSRAMGGQGLSVF